MAEFFSFLRCPITGSKLNRIDERVLEAQQGGRRYPIVHGIPDFRLFDPPYMGRDAEHEVVDRLMLEAQTLGYEDLVRLLERELMPQTSSERIDKGIAHRLQLRNRAPARLLDLVTRTGGIQLPEKCVALDLGCGSGEASMALRELGAGELLGLDISLIELALAKKLLAEQGVESFLVAGCAEALPFSSDLFDFVYSPDVIEHVTDQFKYFKEAHRVLKTGGQVLLNSPNRYSVVCAEPHVGIWGLTFLPRVLIDPACRMMGKGPYIGKRLVSLPELRALVRKNFPRFKISSRDSNPSASSVSGKIYHALRPASVRIFNYVTDQHVVLAEKTAG
ncbi:MAG TPA: class I SAM-dependent methyltransferase [Gammaproteobacteria bacterium]|nr:class I SAM-dependent methyltransferase [Gammaproteobacteria bacterium]